LITPTWVWWMRTRSIASMAGASADGEPGRAGAWGSEAWSPVVEASIVRTPGSEPVRNPGKTLEPVVAPEVERDQPHQAGHHQQDDRVAERPRELRHEVEVHAVDACDERRHHEHYREGGEPLHHRIEVVARHREVGLE